MLPLDDASLTDVSRPCTAYKPWIITITNRRFLGALCALRAIRGNPSSAHLTWRMDRIKYNAGPLQTRPNLSCYSITLASPPSSNGGIVRDALSKTRIIIQGTHHTKDVSFKKRLIPEKNVWTGTWGAHRHATVDTMYQNQYIFCTRNWHNIV